MQTKKRYFSVIIAAALAVLAICAGCEKDSVSVPKKLSGSQWEGREFPAGEWTMGQGELPAVLKFTSESHCVYSVTGADGKTAEYEYTCSYRKPELTLTPVDAGRETLTGDIRKHDSMSIELNLYSKPDYLVFRAYQGKYFEWQ